jgi:hypothetical protein
MYTRKLGMDQQKMEVRVGADEYFLMTKPPKGHAMTEKEFETSNMQARVHAESVEVVAAVRRNSHAQGRLL